MKVEHLKKLGIAVAASMALLTIAAVSASATALHGTGHTPLGAGAPIVASLEVGTTFPWASTNEDPIVTCTESALEGEIVNAGGALATTAISVTHLSFSGSCSYTVDQSKTAILEIHHIAGTTNGTVMASGFYWTIHAPFVGACNYGFGAGHDAGTLAGSTSGAATMSINTVLTEEEPKRMLCPDTARWFARYAFTSPDRLWVEAS